MKKVTLTTRARTTIVVGKPARMVVREPIVAAAWVPVSVERPPHNEWIVYWTRAGFADIAHEWRDDQHLEHATHWLRGYPGPPPNANTNTVGIG